MGGLSNLVSSAESSLTSVAVGLASDAVNSIISNAPPIVGDLLGSLAPSTPSGNSAGSNSGLIQNIPQSERVFTTRSRSINYPGSGDRGQHAYIKIITTNKTASVKRPGATSLNNGPNGGVINQAVNGAIGTGYNSFLLTDVNCSLDEKMQILETFGDSEVTYYFGRQPMMFNIGGILIDSVDNNWFIQWLEMYTHALRGTELAKNYELVTLVLPNMMVVGTITRMSWNQNSARDVDIPFQFTIMAKNILPLPVALPNTPSSNSSSLNLSGVQNFISQAGINGIKAGSIASAASSLLGTIKNPLSTVANYASSLLGFGGVTSTQPSSSSTHVSSLIPTTGNTPMNQGASYSNDLYLGNAAALSGVRASLFSPVYGVLSSLTKLISTVSGTNVTSTMPTAVQNIIRDVTNISTQAVGILNVLEGNSKVPGLWVTTPGLNSNLLANATANLSSTKGIITAQPPTLSSTVLAMSTNGQLPATSNFIKNKITVLSTIPQYSTESAATL